MEITKLSPPCALKSRCQIGERKDQGVRYHSPIVAKILYVLIKIGLSQKTILVSDAKGRKFFLNRKSLIKWIKSNGGENLQASTQDSTLLYALKTLVNTRKKQTQSAPPVPKKQKMIHKPLSFPSPLKQPSLFIIGAENIEKNKQKLLKRGFPESCLQVSANKSKITFKLSIREVEAVLGFSLGAWQSVGLGTEILLAEAQKAIIDDPIDTHRVKWSLQKGSYQQLLADLFAKNQGLCIGENHGDVPPKRFLIDHMECLKKNEVQTLFMELLLYDTMQPFLDKYFKAPKGSKMPPILSTYLQDLTRGHMLSYQPKGKKYDYQTIVTTAKEMGIRIVGIDTSLSIEAGYKRREGSQGRDRHLAMNYVANKIIRHESEGERFVAFMGTTHGSAAKDSITKEHPKPVPGVAELLGVPFLLVEGKKRGSPTNRIQANVREYASGEVAFATLVIQNYDGNQNYALEK